MTVMQLDTQTPRLPTYLAAAVALVLIACPSAEPEAQQSAEDAPAAMDSEALDPLHRDYVGAEVAQLLEVQSPLELNLTLALPFGDPELAVTQARIADEVAGLEVLHRYAQVPGMLVLVHNAEQVHALLAHSAVAGLRNNPLLELDLDASRALIGSPPPAAAAGVRNGALATLAILDDGVQPHAFYRDRLVQEACFSRTTFNGASVTSLCENGRKRPTKVGLFQEGPGSAQYCDDCVHGSHVTGIAAGANGPGSTVELALGNGDFESIETGPLAGVAAEAAIVAIQVFFKALDPEGKVQTYTASSQITQALEHALQLHRTGAVRQLAAVNLSLGATTRYLTPCDEASSAFGDTAAAVAELRRSGTLTVASAGNDGEVGLPYPACLSHVLAVGATTVPKRAFTQGENDTVEAIEVEQLSSFSNYGTHLDVLAPGEQIVSSVAPEAFAALSGTSMAAPHVAGAVTVLRAAMPCARAEEVHAALRQSTTSLDAGGIQVPRLDLPAALAALQANGRRCMQCDAARFTQARPVGDHTALAASVADCAPILVNKAASVGPGSLTEAIERINASSCAGTHLIQFDLPAEEGRVIDLEKRLRVRRPVIIDGFSQPGATYPCNMVHLRGATLSAEASGNHFRGIEMSLCGGTCLSDDSGGSTRVSSVFLHNSFQGTQTFLNQAGAHFELEDSIIGEMIDDAVILAGSGSNTPTTFHLHDNLFRGEFGDAAIVLLGMRAAASRLIEDNRFDESYGPDPRRTRMIVGVNADGITVRGNHFLSTTVENLSTNNADAWLVEDNRSEGPHVSLISTNNSPNWIVRRNTISDAEVAILSNQESGWLVQDNLVRDSGRALTRLEYSVLMDNHFEKIGSDLPAAVSTVHSELRNNRFEAIEGDAFFGAYNTLRNNHFVDCERAIGDGRRNLVLEGSFQDNAAAINAPVSAAADALDLCLEDRLLHLTGASAPGEYLQVYVQDAHPTLQGARFLSAASEGSSADLDSLAGAFHFVFTLPDDLSLDSNLAFALTGTRGWVPEGEVVTDASVTSAFFAQSAVLRSCDGEALPTDDPPDEDPPADDPPVDDPPVEDPPSTDCDALLADLPSISDTAELPAPEAKVSPVLECVLDNGDGNFTALFGYSNRNAGAVSIAAGSNQNHFSYQGQSGQDLGQPQGFEPGRKVGVFTVDFNGSPLVWKLTRATATASGAAASTTVGRCGPLSQARIACLRP